MLEGVLVTFWGAGRWAAVHAAASVPHCRRSARLAAPRPRGLPLLVRAPQRLLRFMGKLLCMGLILRICLTPPPGRLDHTDHCLSASMHMNVLDRHFLLALAVPRAAKLSGCEATKTKQPDQDTNDGRHLKNKNWQSSTSKWLPDYR